MAVATITRLTGIPSIGAPSRRTRKSRKASPLSYVGKDSAPFLIMHGDQDKHRAAGQSDMLARPEEAGVESIW